MKPIDVASNDVFKYHHIDDGGNSFQYRKANLNIAQITYFELSVHDQVRMMILFQMLVIVYHNYNI
jgi:hypothetical protein